MLAVASMLVMIGMIAARIVFDHQLAEKQEQIEFLQDLAQADGRYYNDVENLLDNICESNNTGLMGVSDSLDLVENYLHSKSEVDSIVATQL